MNNTPLPPDKADKRTERRKLGDIGENCACEFLRRRGYEILERNYLRKWGEIDIIARKGRRLHFVEVKSVTYGTAYRPEENMHPGKLKRLARTIQIYLLHPPERLFSRAGAEHDPEWQLDLITASVDLVARQARVEILENIVI